MSSSPAYHALFAQFVEEWRGAGSEKVSFESQLDTEDGLLEAIQITSFACFSRMKNIESPELVQDLLVELRRRGTIEPAVSSWNLKLFEREWDAALICALGHLSFTRLAQRIREELDSKSAVAALQLVARRALMVIYNAIRHNLNKANDKYYLLDDYDYDEYGSDEYSGYEYGGDDYGDESMDMENAKEEIERCEQLFSMWDSYENELEDELKNLTTTEELEELLEFFQIYLELERQQVLSRPRRDSS
ncbi:hypothetical protein F4819DRAFT_487061 [Hypoxylon fuscum]|nr:hypothetical protein F4819DRAFT_487061 [Hypoxylon fuscum]